ncbi:hypothetical protein I5907_17490 [Panacibacter sp. DH6]|uniref:Uncharacterized protein n=1 Tax=Panacibacter microcysteis TaxID=2793269 RepID=A0A931MCD3_9BACT|nr:hypothetical protein [Panacibacter microcysteis]MBG9378036.1 hypothetical protein [Panacibacter microcysteis]
MKSEDYPEESTNIKPAAESFSFPVNAPNTSTVNIPSHSAGIEQRILDEVLSVYESGLESINMPGYDFYEFYKSVAATGQVTEQSYNMAFMMAKTLDKTLTPQKLTGDAEFYISKINEVHSQYVAQGQKKLNALQEQKSSEKNKLTNEIDAATVRISQLRNELQQLESDINQKRGSLSKIDEAYFPEEKSVRDKMVANDVARQASVTKLTTIKEGILKFIKTI